MKYILSIIIFCVSLGMPCMRAQSASAASGPSIVEILQAVPGITIIQPEGLEKRLEKVVPAEGEAAEAAATSSRTNSERRSSYRIEVYSDNTRSARANATTRQRTVRSRFPKYNTQLVFESPFWRVKVGPFTSRSDAEAAMAEIRNAFPGYAPYLRIVRN